MRAFDATLRSIQAHPQPSDLLAADIGTATGRRVLQLNGEISDQLERHLPR